MKLSAESKRILLVNLHNLIAEFANLTADGLQNGRLYQLINYPANGGFTKEEKEEVEKLRGNETLKTAFRKILASNSADVIFSLLNIIDGTADPDFDSANWQEVMLVDFSDDYEETEMLHDDFFSTYWDWREKKKSNWKLDLLDDSNLNTD